MVIRPSDLFFYLSYALYIIWTYQNLTALPQWIPQIVFQASKIGVIAFSLLSLYFRKFPRVYFIYLLSLIGLGLITVFTTHQQSILLIFLLILSSYKMNAKNICKVSLSVNIGLFILTILACSCGKIPDYTYSSTLRTTLSGELIEAHSYGFLHYSSASFIVLFMSIMYLYIKQPKIKYHHVVIVLIMNISAFYYFSTRMPFILSIFVVALVVLSERIRLFDYNNRMWLLIATILPVTLLTLSFGLVFAYKFSNKEIWTLINTALFGDRLRQASVALDKYSLKLFGQNIASYGSYMIRYGGLTSRQIADYLFVDNGYIYAFLEYGIVIGIFIILLYVKAFRYASKSSNIILYIWIFTVCVFAIINSNFFSIEYNP